MLTHSNS